MGYNAPMMGLSPILIGLTVFLIAATTVTAGVLSPKARPVFAFGVLVMMVGIYVGFAIISFDSADYASRAVISVLLVESLAALAFMFAGIAALSSGRVWMLGVLILIHGAFDLGHMVMGAAHSPEWYEFLCLIYDAVVGFAFIYLLSEKPAADGVTRNPEIAPSQ